MKKQIKHLSLALLCLGLTVSCSNPSSFSSSSSSQSESSSESSSSQTINESVKKIVNSVRKTTHLVHVYQTVQVLKPNDSLASDVNLENTFDFGYYYEGEERAYSITSSKKSYDTNKDTGEVITNTISYSSSPKVTYHRDSKGQSYIEECSIGNVASKSYMLDDDEDGDELYTPLIFDTEFKNPFDYISYRDISKNEDGTFSLNNDSADYLAKCYNTIGMNKIKGATISVDSSDRVSSIVFDVPDEIDDSYSRYNTMTVSYSYPEDTSIPHVSEFNNSNPDLETALLALKDKTNFTYYKDFYDVAENDEDKGDISKLTLLDHIAGYYTEDVVYFHHHDNPETDTGPYVLGDDYDYCIVKEDSDNKYHAYEYTNVNGTYSWHVVQLSSSTPYIIDTFTEAMPQFYDISPNIFKKTGDYTYVIEDYFLNTIGQYFDNNVYGADSMVLETLTSRLEITLNEDKSIKLIKTGYNYENKEHIITFQLANIGTTSLPTWYE